MKKERIFQKLIAVFILICMFINMNAGVIMAADAEGVTINTSNIVEYQNMNDKAVQAYHRAPEIDDEYKYTKLTKKVGEVFGITNPDSTKKYDTLGKQSSYNYEAANNKYSIDTIQGGDKIAYETPYYAYVKHNKTLDSDPVYVNLAMLFKGNVNGNGNTQTIDLSTDNQIAVVYNDAVEYNNKSYDMVVKLTKVTVVNYTDSKYEGDFSVSIRMGKLDQYNVLQPVKPYVFIHGIDGMDNIQIKADIETYYINENNKHADIKGICKIGDLDENQELFVYQLKLNDGDKIYFSNNDIDKSHIKWGNPIDPNSVGTWLKTVPYTGEAATDKNYDIYYLENTNLGTAKQRKYVFKANGKSAGASLSFVTYNELTDTSLVTFDKNGGDIDYMSVRVPNGSKVVDPVDPNNKPTKLGYDFITWNTKADGTGEDFNFSENTITSDETLYAKWTPKTYTIIYNANGGTGSMAQENKTYGDNVIYKLKTNKFEKENNNFAGWEIRKNTTTKTAAGENDSISMSELINFASSDNKINIYAQWTPITQHTVSFETGVDGITVDNQKVLDGGKATNPTPTRAGYILVGWYTDPELKNVFDFDTPITQNKILYAKWNENKYKVIYNKNDANATGTMASDDELAYSSKYTIKSNGFVNEGYEFAGWNTKADGTGVDINTTEYNISSIFGYANQANEINLYAKWTEKGQQQEPTPVVKYTVEYNKNNNDAKGTMSSDNNLAYDSSYTIKENEFIRDNYNFVKWNTKQDGSGVSYEENDEVEVSNLAGSSDSDNKIVLYAIWKEKSSNPPAPETGKVTVTFDEKGGLLVADKTIDKGTAITSPETKKIGYTFKGWFIDENDNGIKDESEEYFDFKTKIQNDLTLVADWEANKYTVKFDLDGGKENISDQSVNYNEKVTKPTTIPTKEGYKFYAWYLGDKEYDFNTPIAGDITLKAGWQKVDSSEVPEKLPDTGNFIKTPVIFIAIVTIAGISFVKYKKMKMIK